MLTKIENGIEVICTPKEEAQIRAEWLANEPNQDKALKDACKEKAKSLLALTDWAVLPDVQLTNQADFVAYRATLRDLITNPVQDPQWPTEPQPVWSTK